MSLINYSERGFRFFVALNKVFVLWREGVSLKTICNEPSGEAKPFSVECSERHYTATRGARSEKVNARAIILQRQACPPVRAGQSDAAFQRAAVRQ